MSKEGDKLLYHPEVLKVIRAIVRKVDDPDDAINDTCLKAFANTRTDPPETIERWKAVVRPIAHGVAVDEIRKIVVRRKNEARDVDPDTLIGGSGASAIEAKQDAESFLARMEDLAEQGVVRKDWMVFVEIIFHRVKSDAAAAERGVTGTTHRAQKMRMMRTVATTFGAAFAALAVWAVNRPDARIVAVNVPVYVDGGTSVPSPNPVPSGPPPSILVDTDNRAAAVKEALLRDVDDAIKKKDWKRCMQDLDAVPQDVAHLKSKVETARSQCDEELLRLMNSKAPPR